MEAATQAAAPSTAAEPPPPPVIAIPERVPILDRTSEPPPPAWPLWQGVYTFPWNDPLHVKAWLVVGVGMTIVCALGGWVATLLPLLRSMPFGIPVSAIIAVTNGFLLFVVWTASFAVVDFLAIIEQTAYGNSEVRWPEEMILDRLLRIGYVLWVGICNATPVVVLILLFHAVPPNDSVGWALASVPLVVLFPLLLLVALSADSWLFLNGEMLLSLLRRPLELTVVWLVSALLLFVCVWLGHEVIAEQRYGLAPVAGLVWSAAMLIYGRLLGRLAWLASDDEMPRRRGKRKKAKQEQTALRAS